VNINRRRSHDPATEGQIKHILKFRPDFQPDVLRRLTIVDASCLISTLRRQERESEKLRGPTYSQTGMDDPNPKAKYDGGTDPQANSG
jgi:hypothetical protein